MTPSPQEERSLFSRWVRASFAGWFLGLVLVVLMTFAWDALGVGNAQFMVGVGMGAGVGFAQARTARAWLGRTAPWVWSSVIGMGAPFLLWDILAGVGVRFPNPMLLSVVLGSILVGVLQRPLLARHSDKANWWVPACIAGWTLSAGPATASMSGPMGGLVTVAILLGGIILGVVTGAMLIRILRH